MSRILPMRVALIAIAVLVAVGLAVAVPSSPRETQKTSTDKADPYEQGMDLVKSEDWTGALKIFEQLVVQQPRNPDVLNMLAYTQRKTGNLEGAFENYNRALAIKPKFPEAREYLAEAHLQAALREMETLVGYGSNGEDEVATLSDAFQEAASRVADMHNGGNSKASDKKKSSNW
jgi:cytochrome c-type biogenesis protein CcmH/NrfG